MKNIKNTLLVSTLSLGLIIGAVGVAGAANSINYQHKIAEWVKDEPNPAVMNTNSSIAPADTPVTAPAPAQVVTPVTAPVANPVPTPENTPVTVPSVPVNQYHYNDGHSNMNPQQHQQLHYGMNGNSYQSTHNENHNSMSGNHHMSEYGHE